MHQSQIFLEYKTPFVNEMGFPHAGYQDRPREKAKLVFLKYSIGEKGEKSEFCSSLTGIPFHVNKRPPATIVLKLKTAHT